MTILRGDGSGRCSEEEVVRDLASADQVVLGEIHRHPSNLLYLELVERIFTRETSFQLALEFYTRDEQPQLDAFSVDDEEVFAIKGHLAFIRLANEYGRRVVAANAPKKYVALARAADGYEQLKQLSSERSFFALPEAVDHSSQYYARFETIMTEMQVAQASIDGMYRAQCLWDATMADSLLNSKSPKILIVGFFHVIHGGGVVAELRRQAPLVRIRTCVTLQEEYDSLLPHHLNIADYVIYVGRD